MFIYKMSKNLSENIKITWLPVPQDLTLFWNFGSLLGVFLALQMATGILLATSFFLGPETFNLNSSAPSTMAHILRYFHANGASLIFVFLYLHIGRGIYYMSYKKKHAWTIGVSMFILMMATAFMGYVLPVNQMSFWGASVITSLSGEIPWYGTWLMNVLWGDWSVFMPLYTRFFSIHYFLPFMIMMMVLLHILFLHNTGSSSPTGAGINSAKKKFLLYFTISDMLAIFIIMMFMIYMHLGNFDVWDHDVSAKSSTVITPVHIQPEWYFLYAYAILRAIPSKLGGVIALVLAVSILYIMPYILLMKKNNMKTYSFNQLMFWVFIMMVLLLTWIGKSPAEDPYIGVSRIFMVFYFAYFFINQVLMYIWDKLNF